MDRYMNLKRPENMAEHMGTVLCVEGLRHGMFGFPIALGQVAVV